MTADTTDNFDPQHLCNPCWTANLVCKFCCCGMFFLLLAFMLTAYLLIGSSDELDSLGTVMGSDELWTIDIFLVVLAAALALLFFVSAFFIRTAYYGCCAGFGHCLKCKCCRCMCKKKHHDAPPQYVDLRQLNITPLGFYPKKKGVDDDEEEEYNDDDDSKELMPSSSSSAWSFLPPW